MSVPVDELPDAARRACLRLRDEVSAIAGDDLVALWAYGAAVFDDRPKRLGDVDTHGILSRAPAKEQMIAIDRAHEEIASQAGIEWDSWYILEAGARGASPPLHALRTNLPDGAWALHRAHWLAGRYVHLLGLRPEELVQPPSWEELEEALGKEMSYVEELVEEGRDDPGHASFCVWNACRIVCSLDTRRVVVSKREAARWGLQSLPGFWHAALEAAGRVYDDEQREGDAELLKEALPGIVAAARHRVG